MVLSSLVWVYRIGKNHLTSPLSYGVLSGRQRKGEERREAEREKGGNIPT